MNKRNSKRKTVFRGLTSHDRALLAAEDIDSEFKEKATEIKPETFVSFANSSGGGYILVGVRDDSTIVGTEYDDETLTALQSRASSCFPPVSAELTVANASSKPIIKIHVPSSPQKPHCTAGGKYVIRVKNRLQAMAPSQLLALFLERESNTFLGRFEEASYGLLEETKSLRNLVGNVQDTVNSHLHGVVGSLGEVEVSVRQLPKDLEGLRSDLARVVESETEKIEGATQRVEELVESLHYFVRHELGQDIRDELECLHHKLDSLMIRMGSSDPQRDARVQALKRELLKVKPALDAEAALGIEVSNPMFAEIRAAFGDLLEDEFADVVAQVMGSKPNK